ncbi:MAG TPA: cryptochrome/photolyase family protein [Kiritimatiellia bacterium]|nr:cryptochrome/photolyase family protein [Kiritimatiellia bacterium]
MSAVTLVFPHHLFDPHPALAKRRPVLLIEDSLFFKDPVWKVESHRLKIDLHRRSMAAYATLLRKRGLDVEVVPYDPALTLARHIEPWLKRYAVTELHVCEVVDDVLNRRLVRVAQKIGIKLVWYDSPMFLNTAREIDAYYDGKSRYAQTDFYIHQRKRLGILVEGGKPVGGKWTFDAENRKRWPKGRHPPQVYRPAAGPYPVTHQEAREALHHFLVHRFKDFGAYEDAIVASEPILHHSVLTPALNIGLLTPRNIVEETLAYAEEHAIPLNSLEGFLRQIIGWREFMRAVYQRKGVTQRNGNFWNHQRPMPRSFYTGTTGLAPFDMVVRRLLETAYCHHIERLMIAGNLMLLCGIHPDAVYRWFMELFIDAYDWVMVPNVYGMSQFADGGLITTKPYLSGSNYLRKMSDLPPGPWCEVWDGLYWRFIDLHREFFVSQPRLGMMARLLDAMPPAKRKLHHRHAEGFLETCS